MGAFSIYKNIKNVVCKCCIVFSRMLLCIRKEKKKGEANKEPHR